MIARHDTIEPVRRFLADGWRSARRPAVLRRCAGIALVVGTLLSLVNQGHVVLAGDVDRWVALRILANYLIPFVVSNLGALASMREESRRRS